MAAFSVVLYIVCMRMVYPWQHIHIHTKLVSNTTKYLFVFLSAMFKTSNNKCKRKNSFKGVKRNKPTLEECRFTKAETEMDKN